MATRQKVSRTTFYSGPFQGVRNTTDPFDADPAYLFDAINLYSPDPTGGTGLSARPGFRLLFGGDPVVVQAAPFRGQEVYPHTMLDGSVINFFVMAGKLFRTDAAINTYTDVTPVGVTIDAAITTRVFFCSESGILGVSDGVNRPWLATNLTSTPITGTYLDYDGMGVSWSIFGAPRIYLGAMFGILNQVNGVARRADISWSEPGDFTTGWQQSGFDNNMTPSQNQGTNLYALFATELALYYFRENSIGNVSGSDTGNLASTATTDAIGFNIGSQCSQSIRAFGNGFFFCDALGRPYYYQPGVPPEPIWKQMRAAIEAAASGFPSTTAIVCTSVIEPTLNKYLVGIFSPNPSTQAPVTEIHVFDAQTRKYEGHWQLTPKIAIETIGIFLDSSARATLIILGSLAAAPAVGGYVWAFNALTSATVDLSTEDGDLITTEDGLVLCTEGLDAIWKDNGYIPYIYATTDRFGYSEDVLYHVDTTTAITLSPTPCTIQITTPSAALTFEGTPVPAASQDGTNRLVCGCDIYGRGPTVSISPITAESQWNLQRLAVSAVPELAGPTDP